MFRVDLFIDIRIVSFDQLLEAVEQHTQTNAKFSPEILQEENLDVHAVLVPSARSATFHPLGRAHALSMYSKLCF